MIKLTPRLQCVADMTPQAACVADIGTDHAYLPIYLVLNKKAEKAVACDIRKGPLESALSNIKHYGLCDKIKTVLCDGLAGLEDGQVQTAVIAGMGGELIASIINARPDAAQEYILQPMSKISTLRKSLQENGFKIDEEALALEGEKLYTVMRVKKGHQNWSEHELVFSPALREHPLYGVFLQKHFDSVSCNLENIRQSGNSKVIKIFEEKKAEAENEIRKFGGEIK